MLRDAALACTPLWSLLVLLAPLRQWSRKMFQSSPTCDNFVNVQSVNASPEVKVSVATKHINFS